ncbi:ABC transporter ATP-binding protein [Staphylococcus haemolyticus]|uniref:ABC transporter ATP-binding protein n=2 Tax=Staphylococcus haemolyticus TaxID=1283 RepID=UPI00061A3136|nr:ABC transporter ATP-binding protein [Staphylococcus haemolyticus]AKC75196.1 ABC transporter ATP-binding protein [Staphylococcus haemolyticus]MBD3928062.1 ABC transporter ATP-binding protein [Staphylococcus haemolyticus]MBK3952690.1 ABC transporter ATP-binding protein [Staphylococcus haemolyticus]MBO1276682.1 ABC transporter ATP-binding protein [Staphylococcus haemolyticus]MBW3857475.1 ABC transporter ATP-binding protein [Staphylococcus haemolyticus]
MLLDVKNVKKTFGRGLNATIALNGISFTVDKGEFVAIMGESGSGKSTLLNLIATFDKVSEGNITINNQDIRKLSNKQIAHFRRDNLGFVFQDFNVLPTMTNRDNILMPLVLANRSHKVMEQRMNALSSKLGIEKLLSKYPYQVSGGEQQRIAIGRALINEPDLLLADEPTGALDSKTSKQIMTLFREINDNTQTILMVTHSSIDASYAKRVLFIKDGRLYHEIYRGEESQHDFQKRIADSLAILNESGD